MTSSETPANDNSDNCRPDASRMTAIARRDLSLLTVEEKIIYRKWQRAALIVYSAVAIIIATLWIAIGPSDTSPSSKNATYSADATAAHKSPR